MTAPASAAARAGAVEDVLIVAGLIAVQIIFSVYTLLLHRFLSLGVDSLSIVVFGGLASSLLLLPFAVALEKKKWPAKLSPAVAVQMLLAAVTGTAFQVLMMYGIKMTSPAIASSMPNLAPAFIFVIAACARFERFSVWCRYSRAKVVGTVLCLGGAMAMSFLMSPPPDLDPSALHAAASKGWILGCLCLLLAMVLLSCNVVLQAAAMVSFQAPLSLCAVTTLMGSVFTAALRFVTRGSLDAGSSSIGLGSVVGLVMLGAVVTSVCVGFQTWCIKKKGPVMVSIFNPVQTVFSAVLSAVVLGQVIDMGSVAGMLLMFAGLYVVLWAKKKEDCDGVNETDDVVDIERPLLY